LPDLQQKLEHFNAFYLIAHPLKLNIEPASAEQATQSIDEFVQSMPYAFRISSQMSEIEANALRPFRRAMNEAVKVGTFSTIKLFLENEAAAIFCIGEVVKCEKHEDVFAVSYAYSKIREEDQELLVRASLHLQTSQLRKSHEAH